LIRPTPITSKVSNFFLRHWGQPPYPTLVQSVN
jgi:hypothetical protein